MSKLIAMICQRKWENGQEVSKGEFWAGVGLGAIFIIILAYVIVSVGWWVAFR